jgi:hypothetical protein
VSNLPLGRLTAPSLPLAPERYDVQQQAAFSNVLRLYFNGINNTVNNLLGDLSLGTTFKPGGGYLAFPYAAIQRTTDLTFTANTATEVTFDTNDYINYCENDGTNGITVNMAGIYNYQYSVQWVNTDTQIHTGYLWLRVNNVDVPGTASKFDILEKHGGVDGYVIGAANFYVQLEAGDYVSLFAAVSDAAVYMEAYAAQTSPFPMPSIPSVVATLTFVSRLP